MIGNGSLNKAAYRVLVERWQPHLCFSPQRLEEIETDFYAITRWALDQTKDISSAYSHAMIIVMGEVRNWYDRHQESFAAEAAYKTIIKPPLVIEINCEPEKLSCGNTS